MDLVETSVRRTLFQVDIQKLTDDEEVALFLPGRFDRNTERTLEKYGLSPKRIEMCKLQLIRVFQNRLRFVISNTFAVGLLLIFLVVFIIVATTVLLVDNDSGGSGGIISTLTSSGLVVAISILVQNSNSNKDTSDTDDKDSDSYSRKFGGTNAQLLKRVKEKAAADAVSQTMQLNQDDDGIELESFDSTSLASAASMGGVSNPRTVSRQGRSPASSTSQSAVSQASRSNFAASDLLQPLVSASMEGGDAQRWGSSSASRAGSQGESSGGENSAPSLADMYRRPSRGETTSVERRHRNVSTLHTPSQDGGDQ